MLKQHRATAPECVLIIEPVVRVYVALKLNRDYKLKTKN